MNLVYKYSSLARTLGATAIRSAHVQREAVDGRRARLPESFRHVEYYLSGGLFPRPRQRLRINPDKKKPNLQIGTIAAVTGEKH